MTEREREEILEAAVKGINEHLNSTRGARLRLTASLYEGHTGIVLHDAEGRVLFQLQG